MSSVAKRSEDDMSNVCCYVLKQGKRKNERCEKKVSKSCPENKFCCAHTVKTTKMSTELLDKLQETSKLSEVEGESEEEDLFGLRSRPRSEEMENCEESEPSYLGALGEVSSLSKEDDITERLEMVSKYLIEVQNEMFRLESLRLEQQKIAEFINKRIELVKELIKIY